LNAGTRVPMLVPFRVHSFRFQWPADLATSWAFEMEMLILGWYVLVETQSVFMLTVFASLQYIGTLLAPMFGVMGDRAGHRNVLCAMRALYALLATLLMTFAFMDAVTPLIVMLIAAVLGLVRPSDIGMRTALVGETMPPAHLMGAMSIQRTTQDSARIAGALTGAGLVAAMGMGPAYAVVVAFYLCSFMLTLKAGGSEPARQAPAQQRATPWRDLRESLSYVWHAPQLRATMLLAFLLNLTAFPLFNGLMPYVAKEVYGADQTTHLAAGIPALMLAGCMQTMGLIPINALLLRTSDNVIADASWAYA
jgi:MFS family permease